MADIPDSFSVAIMGVYEFADRETVTEEFLVQRAVGHRVNIDSLVYQCVEAWYQDRVLWGKFQRMYV